MLAIFLHESQRELLPAIRRMCPDLAPTRRSRYPNYRGYRASRCEGMESLAQAHWLHQHHVLYFDLEQVREQRARAFLRRTSLDPRAERTLSLSFARTEQQRELYRLRMRSWRQEAMLYLLPGWTGLARAGRLRIWWEQPWCVGRARNW